MKDPAVAMDRRHRLVRAFSWLGALAVAATMAMGVGHASIAASEASLGQASAPDAAAAHEVGAHEGVAHEAATHDVVIASPVAQVSGAHAAVADCANCGDHTETVMLTCMLVTVVAMLLAVAVPRALPSWSRRLRILRPAVVPLPRTFPAPVNLTRLGISRT